VYICGKKICNHKGTQSKSLRITKVKIVDDQIIMIKKVLFIDRDGTILVEPEDEQVDSFEKLAFLPGAI